MKIQRFRTFWLIGLFCGFGASIAMANYPQWWINQSVVNTNSVTTNDYAMVNQGQLKHIATQAYDEFANLLPGTDLSSISNMVASFSSSNNYCAVNIGQVKFIAQPFYDVLFANNLTNSWPSGMSAGPYPWSASSGITNDYAAVNIGQVKYVFSFDLNILDTDGDGLSDTEEANYGTNPNLVDTDGDGISDGVEVLSLLATDPLNSDTTSPSISIVSPVTSFVVVP